MIHFAYGIWTFVSALVVVIAAALYRLIWYRSTSYTYSLTSFLSRKNFASYHPYKKILFALHVMCLLLLAFLLAKPQLADTSSKVHGEGIDIIVVLDVSGSMLFFDDPRNPKARIDIAKEEALRFVDKRTSDPIGLVIFGREAVSRCPLTLDKHILKDIISHLQIGVIREDGTVLAKGMMVAASRLKNSKSKSKIMILLTDGEPSPEDSSPDQAIDMAEKMGIKVYTIGIGDTNGGYFAHPQSRRITINLRSN
jgi:Ca-activated chloride channel family protein